MVDLISFSDEELAELTRISDLNAVRHIADQELTSIQFHRARRLKDLGLITDGRPDGRSWTKRGHMLLEEIRAGC